MTIQVPNSSITCGPDVQRNHIDGPFMTARPIDEWHEDFGYAVWWTFKDGDWLGEPSYIGSPLCDDWPGYHTHWTPHPKFPAAPSLEQETRPAECDHAGWSFETHGRGCIKCGATLADFGD